MSPNKLSQPFGNNTVAFLLASLIAYFYLASSIYGSRIFLGIHYPSDILAGALLD
jgi:membrane-associated phospholipid phosphatase